MALSGQDIVKRAMEGRLSLEEIRAQFNTTPDASVVSVQDWSACYSAQTGLLSQSCIVASTIPDNSINGVGLLTYSTTSSTLYAAQFTDGVNSPQVSTVLSNLFNPSDDTSVLCVVWGGIFGSSFYVQRTLTIGKC